MAVSGIGRRSTASGPTADPSGGTDPAGQATVREDLVTVLFGACLIGGVIADGWAHANLPETLEGFFTPWHGLLYAGFTGCAAWTFWLAYRRRDRAPYWWRDGWPNGYRIGALGVLIFLAGGFADMVWHETLGVEVGLNAAFSPSHLLIVVGAVLLLTSPLRSWWASSGGRLRAGTGVAALTLSVMGPTIILTHSSALVTDAPTQGYDPRPGGGSNALLAIVGINSYLLTTLLLTLPLLLVHRRRAAPGAATALTFGVSLMVMVIFEFPGPQAAGALGAVLGAAIADVLLLRLDAMRGTSATLRLPLAGALFAALIWTGHLLGTGLADDLRWPIEMITGIVVESALLGALLGGLAARPVAHGVADPADADRAVPATTPAAGASPR